MSDHPKSKTLNVFHPSEIYPLSLFWRFKKPTVSRRFFHYFGGRPKWILKSPSTKLKGSPQVFSSEHFLRTGLLGTIYNVRAFWEVSYPHMIFWCYPTYHSKGPRAKKGSPKHLTFQAQAWQLLGVKMGWFFCVFFVVVLVVTVNESPAHTNYFIGFPTTHPKHAKTRPFAYHRNTFSTKIRLEPQAWAWFCGAGLLCGEWYGCRDRADRADVASVTESLSTFRIVASQIHQSYLFVNLFCCSVGGPGPLKI